MGDRYDLPGDFRAATINIKSTIYEQAASQPVAPEELTAAQQQLATLPLDTIPDPAPLPPGSRMPLSRNPLFVGREADLQVLAVALKGGEIPVIGQVAAATGLGGIGKTQLASEFVHRYGQFFAGGVFWLSLSDAAAVSTEVAGCGGPGGLDLHPNFSTLPIEDQVRLVRSAWLSPLPRLLIFDNCEEETLLAQWRPTSGGSRVLVTSRRMQWDMTLGVQTLALGILSRKESIALLGKHRPDLPADDTALDVIADALGDLPLALHLAGSYLARYRHAVTPAEYLAQLEQPDLLQHRSLQTGGLSPTGHEQHVARTFALSYDRLDPADDTDALALALLARAAYCAPGEPIPRELLRTTVGRAGEASALQTEDALTRLAALGLLEVEALRGLRLHRLLAVFVQRETGNPTIQATVEAVVFTELRRVNNGGNPWPVLNWQPHLRVVTNVARVRADEQAAALCNEFGCHLRRIGDLSGARPYLERALAICEQVLGEQHPNTAASLNNLGSLLQAQGDLSSAQPYYERALAIREQVLREQHPDTATSLNSLGYLLQAQGDLAGARPYLKRALAIREQVLGEQHPDTAGSLNNLGMLLQAQGDLAGARPYLKRALAICEQVLGEQHPDTAISLNNLGGLLRVQGDLAGARAYYERALRSLRAALGEQHPSTQTVQSNLEALLVEGEGPHGQTEGTP